MYKVAILVLIAVIVEVNSHGRLMRPVNRSSIFRVPEFASLNPPPNWDDHQLYCGAVHQHEVVGGNCGVCGDPFARPTPRDNEMGGRFYRGIITGRYSAGSVIDIDVQLTAAHLGFFEFRLCTSPLNGGETQQCFNQHVLQRADGRGARTPVDQGPTWYFMQYRLPAGVTCQRCVLQWNYRAGNTWGTCPDGSNGPGCGPQETFRGCSDITIS